MTIEENVTDVSVGDGDEARDDSQQLVDVVPRSQLHHPVLNLGVFLRQQLDERQPRGVLLERVNRVVNAPRLVARLQTSQSPSVHTHLDTIWKNAILT